MARRTALKGVLHGFLGTFTSRNNDLDGYWLFAQLVVEAAEIECDLLSPCSNSGLSGLTCARAHETFRSQVSKARLPAAWIREARLRISKGSASRVVVNGHSTWGVGIDVTASVTTDTGRRFENSVTLAVAPHNPAIEFRSTRAI